MINFSQTLLITFKLDFGLKFQQEQFSRIPGICRGKDKQK